MTLIVLRKKANYTKHITQNFIIAMPKITTTGRNWQCEFLGAIHI